MKWYGCVFLSALLSIIVLALLSSCHQPRETTDFYIEQELILTTDQMGDAAKSAGWQTPYLQTWIWHKGEIVESWVNEKITDDSTMIRRRMFAEEYIKLLKSNTP